jgi:hypothetical protein
MKPILQSVRSAFDERDAPLFVLLGVVSTLSRSRTVLFRSTPPEETAAATAPPPAFLYAGLGLISLAISGMRFAKLTRQPRSTHWQEESAPAGSSLTVGQLLR